MPRRGLLPESFLHTSAAAGFRYQRRQLYAEGVALKHIAADVGTPTYVYSRAAIERAFVQLDTACRSLPHTLCYAVKANSNLAILRLFVQLGSGFDIVSGGELERVRRVGGSPDRIVFSGVGKSREEIREALRAGILLLNVESEAELELVAEQAAQLRRPASVSLRVNPDVRAGNHPHIRTGHHKHKFGVDWPEARRLYLRHRRHRWLRWQGISAHIGSQILRVEPFRRAARRLAGYVEELARAGLRLRYLDFGGGIGVRYWRERPFPLPVYVRTLSAAFVPLGCHLLLEPGRLLVAHAGVLLTRVLYTKQTRRRTFVIVDAAMNDFLRPALYGSVHPALPVRLDSWDRRSRVTLVGPACETGDCFLEDWPLPPVRPGDLLVLWGAGAYGMGLASNYNSRPRPAEVLVEGRGFRVVRRRETRNDLWRGEQF
ncbi:MAG: diaminopimelate decarboxylase [Firmicutes bacterium]|nr:diaminopimelate decarboxylase [Bacillota bacterium]